MEEENANTKIFTRTDIVARIWRWHSEHGENTCDECSGNDGTVYETKEGIPDIPVHPNCRCWVEEATLNEAGKKIGSKVYKGQKPETQKASDMKFEQAYNKLQEPEGGYTDGKDQVDDEPTNMGISSPVIRPIFDDIPFEAYFQRGILLK